jgi:hypothetical protein
MTPALQNRWQSRLSPFNGTTISIVDDPTPDDVLLTLRTMADWLRQRYPTILQFDDWHEHDGFLTEPKAIDWVSVDCYFRDLQSWKSVSPDDDYVRMAIFPPSFDWLIRCGLASTDIESVDESWPYLDFTVAANSNVSELIRIIEDDLPGYTSIDFAARHFNACYAG